MLPRTALSAELRLAILRDRDSHPMKHLPCLHRGDPMEARRWSCHCPAVRAPLGVTVELCQGCVFRDRPLDELTGKSRKHPKPGPGPCIHRGEQVDTGTADLCGRKGQKFPVYACALHGECVIGAFCRRQKWRSCLQCEDQTDPLPESQKS